MTITMKSLIFPGLIVSLACGNVVAEEVNYGTRIPTSDELIDTLSPDDERPQAKTRGILFNQQADNPTTETDTTSSAKPATENAASLQILFAFDSSALTANAVKQLHPLGKALRSSKLAKLQFTVEGHTDGVGSALYNQSLSERRALAIKSHLVKNYEVPTEQLVTVGLGESALLVPDKPSAATNRRVRIVTN